MTTYRECASSPFRTAFIRRIETRRNGRSVWRVRGLGLSYESRFGLNRYVIWSEDFDSIETAITCAHSSDCTHVLQLGDQGEFEFSHGNGRRETVRNVDEAMLGPFERSYFGGSVFTIIDNQFSDWVSRLITGNLRLPVELRLQVELGLSSVGIRNSPFMFSDRSRMCMATFDRENIDGLVNYSGKFSSLQGDTLRRRFVPYGINVRLMFPSVPLASGRSGHFVTTVGSFVVMLEEDDLNSQLSPMSSSMPQVLSSLGFHQKVEQIRTELNAYRSGQTVTPQNTSGNHADEPEMIIRSGNVHGPTSASAPQRKASVPEADTGKLRRSIRF